MDGVGATKHDAAASGGGDKKDKAKKKKKKLFLKGLKKKVAAGGSAAAGSDAPAGAVPEDEEGKIAHWNAMRAKLGMSSLK